MTRDHHIAILIESRFLIQGLAGLAGSKGAALHLRD